MFIHLGNNVVINNEDIIGFFDFEKTTVSKVNKEYLTKMEKNNKIINVDVNELPKSYIVTEEKGEILIYLSNLTVQTIYKRNKMKNWRNKLNG